VTARTAEYPFVRMALAVVATPVPANRSARA
jgi:hypothetical protein